MGVGRGNKKQGPHPSHLRVWARRIVQRQDTQVVPLALARRRHEPLFVCLQFFFRTRTCLERCCGLGVFLRLLSGDLSCGGGLRVSHVVEENGDTEGAEAAVGQFLHGLRDGLGQRLVLAADFEHRLSSPGVGGWIEDMRGRRDTSESP